MRKAKIIQLAKINNLIENYRYLRRFLIDASLEHQVQAYRATDDFTSRVYHMRCCVAAEVCLVLIKRARVSSDFYRYLDRISGGALTHDLDSRKWCYGPEGLLLPYWLAGRAFILRFVRAYQYDDGNLTVSVVVNSRFKVMIRALGLDALHATTYGVRIFSRFAEIQLSCEPFPTGGLPQKRLLESELIALFLRDGGFYELSKD